MSITTHILLATDFSEAANEAVAMAHEFARTLGVRLTILHVHGRPPGAPEAVVPTEYLVTSADLDAESREALEQLKNARFADLEAVSLATVEHGSPPLAICEYAEAQGIDMVVMGTHGRTGVGRFLIGSVAEKVVRHASCPVLVVPHAKGRTA